MLGGFANDEEVIAAACEGDDELTPNIRADDKRVSFGIGGGDATALELTLLLSVVSLPFLIPEMSAL